MDIISIVGVNAYYVNTAQNVVWTL